VRFPGLPGAAFSWPHLPDQRNRQGGDLGNEARRIADERDKIVGVERAREIDQTSTSPPIMPSPGNQIRRVDTILPQPFERRDFHKRLRSAGWPEGGRAVDDETPQSRAEHFRGVAENLRSLAAANFQYDIRRRDQLLALADGFARFADRLELQAADD